MVDLDGVLSNYHRVFMARVDNNHNVTDDNEEFTGGVLRGLMFAIIPSLVLWAALIYGVRWALHFLVK